MDKNTYLIQLEKILEEKEFHRLETFQDPTCWKVMSPVERELLGTLFVLQGNELIHQGKPDAMNCYKLAAKAAPASSKVFYKLGEAYAEMGQNLRNLKAACRSFQKAIRLNPEYFEAWAAGALTETMLADLCQDAKGFQSAHEKFHGAYKLALQREDLNPAKLCWRWGGCWYRMGKLSGEAYDFHQALDKFHKSRDFGMDDPDFWNDFGNLMAEQAYLVGRIEFFDEATSYYQKCIEQSPKNMGAWLNLACAKMRVFEYTYDREAFQEAEEAFRQASEIEPHHVALWLFWGCLELLLAKVERDTELLQSSVEKFELADICEPNHPLVLLRWGEALMCWGSQEEQYEILKEAEEKIRRSVEIEGELPDGWYFYGRCLSEIGHYFHDKGYFIRAIEKYQQGLKLAPSFYPFHYGLALAYMEMSDNLQEDHYLESSLKHFMQLNESACPLPAQFWLDYGIACLRMAEFKKEKSFVDAAISKLEKCLLLQEKTTTTPLFTDSLYNYASAIQALGDFSADITHYEKAIRFYRQILKEDPDYTHARFNLAEALMHLGDLQGEIEHLKEAGAHFEILLLQDPENDFVHADLGSLLISIAELMKDPVNTEEYKKLMDESEQRLLTAISLGCQAALYTLACCYSQMGKFEEALHYLEKAHEAKELPPLDDILQDEWLTGLRSQAAFRSFLSRLVKDSL